MKSPYKLFAIGMTALAVAGCGGGGFDQVQLPEDETNLSCEAVIYAAESLVDEASVPEDQRASVSSYVALMTQYSTAHAREEGLDANAALGAVKIKAFRLTGRIDGEDMIYSDEGILKRAKACAGG